MLSFFANNGAKMAKMVRFIIKWRKIQKMERESERKKAHSPEKQLQIIKLLTLVQFLKAV